VSSLSDAQPGPGPVGEPPAQPVLRVSNITAGYGRSTVLRDVSVDIPPGQIVALLGPNGAGKTTTLRTVAGLLRPASGAVWLGGTEVTKWAPHQRARAGHLGVDAGEVQSVPVGTDQSYASQ
jgi:branched-chain amino acid transport system ATP-binding protein